VTFAREGMQVNIPGLFVDLAKLVLKYFVKVFEIPQKKRTFEIKETRSHNIKY
jgi:hypothetical protein